MGCFWSREDRERCHSCGRHHNLVIIDHQCELCRARQAQIQRAKESYAGLRRTTPVYSPRPRPKEDPRITECEVNLQNVAGFGEYRCVCGRFWESRLSWPNKHQICKRCKRQVLAFRQRELQPSDMTGVKEKCEEHPKELCQMCQQLGKYCGNYRRGIPSSSGFNKGKTGTQGYSKRANKTRRGHKV